MWQRATDKVVTSVFIIVFMVLAIIYALDTDRESLYHGVRAITCAILSLTAAQCYRYFED